MAASLMKGAESWLVGAARGFWKKYPHGLVFDELFAEGWLMMTQLVPRYDPKRGAKFATFCAPYVIKRWHRLRAKMQREIPVGGWIELVGSMKDEGAERGADTDGGDHTRLRGMVDTLFMASAMTVNQTGDRCDFAKCIRWVEQLPEPQRSLLLGLFCEDKTQAELAVQLGLTRGTARSQIRLGMEALRMHARVDLERAP